jgi:hypothetical protein
MSMIWQVCLFYSFQTKYTDAFAGTKRGFKEFLRNKLSLTTG